MPSSIDDLVGRVYAARGENWKSAEVSLRGYLTRRAAAALEGGDPSRLKVPEGRIKDRCRAAEKLRRKEPDFDPPPDCEIEALESILGDLIGVKILCKSARDQELIVSDLVAQATDDVCALVGRVKDYASEPKPSGYRAVHLAYKVRLPGVERPVHVEVQIKTMLQDAWGELTHEDLYKPGEAFKPTAFHEAVALTMANLLAEVDRLADRLAEDLAATIAPETEFEDLAASSDNTFVVTVRSTGPTYALAVDTDGRQGLIPAYAVRDAADVSGFIAVDDYVKAGDRLSVRAVENDRGFYFLPTVLTERP